MKLKELERLLQSVQPFAQPSVQLEQYPTSPHLAAQMLFAAHNQFADIEQALVADLGVGCGVLAIAAAAMGAGACLGVDVCGQALQTARENLSATHTADVVELVQAEIGKDAEEEGEEGEDRAGFVLRRPVDTVVMNPPFGTKHNAGIDMRFLRTAVELSEGAVYSLHKTSTRRFVERQAGKWGVKAQVVAELRYNLPQTFKFHKKNSVDIEVDFWRFDCSCKER